ncbi:hypothetical protein [Blautia sp. An81]|uniref:Nmad3 family putative nucleotide modification protein n=1 Tax=Blautia sp. An81 TaxID=1965659 RepID=UPI000B3A6E81|nr:hypothetical protein [Blautia sp. An81]OUN26140.1 hypothetical protein B5G33_16945 [Blautia sp. An81]
MKVVLSRKGFDSANGGIMSPIFEDGTMVSFPIPSKDMEKDNIRYDELFCDGICMKTILNALGYRGVEHCHLDPDLVKDRRRESIREWTPAFGQINQAATYLKNQHISEGDLFLFFGNFRHIKQNHGKYEYVRRTDKTEDTYLGMPLQVVWGYLQVGGIITDPDEQKKLFWHPHACDKRIYEEKNNVIFTASKQLSFAPEMPGAGTFLYDKKRVLTMPGKSKATWKYCKAYDTDNIESNRKNSEKGIDEGIYYAGIWQELVLKENRISEEWAKSLF